VQFKYLWICFVFSVLIIK